MKKRFLAEQVLVMEDHFLVMVDTAAGIVAVKCVAMEVSLSVEGGGERERERERG
jgi:hypothetical protein